MTHTLAEIKKMLEEISSWPWAHGEPIDGVTYIGTGHNIVDGYNFGVRNKDAKFIASAPQIISELVAEVERLQDKYEIKEEEKFKISKEWQKPKEGEPRMVALAGWSPKR